MSVNVSRCLNSRLLFESEAQNLLSSVALCSCGPTVTFGKVGMGSGMPGVRLAGVIQGDFETTG